MRWLSRSAAIMAMAALATAGLVSTALWAEEYSGSVTVPVPSWPEDYAVAVTLQSGDTEVEVTEETVVETVGLGKTATVAFGGTTPTPSVKLPVRLKGKSPVKIGGPGRLPKAPKVSSFPSVSVSGCTDGGGGAQVEGRHPSHDTALDTTVQHHNHEATLSSDGELTRAGLCRQ